MSEFDTAYKTSARYIDRAANGNGYEKAMLTIMALGELGEQGVENAKIVEIGPGGGAALTALSLAYDNGTELGLPPKPEVNLVELDGISSPALLESMNNFERHGPVTLTKGDARDLDTILPEPVHVVAASAVLHEVYSYGKGYAGVDETLGAVARSLEPGGYFSYRDVFSVDGMSQHERTRHIYDKAGWVRFAKLFLPYYIDNATHPYHHEDDKVVYLQDSVNVRPEKINSERQLTINAPVGVLRELQRHYITFRDHCWRTGALGLTPELEGPLSSEWINRATGHKRIYYKNGKTSYTPHPLLEKLSEDAGNGFRAIDGDIFDKTTEAEIGKFLELVESGDEAAQSVWEEWLKREGSETYVYMTVSRLLGAMVMRSLEATDGKTILMPSSSQDVVITPRAYYNRFLGQLSAPLYDGKQLVLARAMDVKKDQELIIAATEGLAKHCSRNTMARIYDPIRKVL